MTFEVPKLGYEFSALEPFIDAKTMEIHHDKHHKAYVDKLNSALEVKKDLQNRSVEELIKNLSTIPAEIKTAVQNHGGGHVNHTFFWKILKKGTKFKGKIADAINETFGSLDEFKTKFKEAATTQFGSGWAWLVLNDNGKLEIMKTPNQDSPLTQDKIPIIGIDVWEHAYYLKYQNKRPDYIDAFFNVINWEQANENFVEAKK